MSNRVVITGMGAVTPIGNTVSELWNSVKNNTCGIDFIKEINVENHKVKIAAEVKNFNPDSVLERKESKRMDKYCKFAMVASEEAVREADFNFEQINSDRFGVIVGSGVGGLETLESEHIKLQEKGPNRVSPFMIPMLISNIAAGNIAIRYGAKGPCMSIVTACATGTNCIGEAYRLIKEGRADIVIAGGCEAPITPMALAGFTSLTALTKSEDVTRASIPFDKNRSGFVMGEGAGILVLESLEHAQKRGGKIKGEIVGYGTTCDAYHITQPSNDGSGAAKAMKLAIDEANIKTCEISYINAHGTSTPFNDKFETLAIKNVFGDYAYNIPVSSTKSMMGHLLGAAGAVEGIICVKALEDGYIPATIGLSTKDEECDLDYVPNVGRNKRLNYAMSNSLGFGGHNGTLIFKKWEDTNCGF